MCGRMSQDRDRVLRELPKLIPNLRISPEITPEKIYADHGIRTTNSVLAVRWSNGGPELVEMRWGYVPTWVKDIKQFKASTINAVSEEVHEKPMWKGAWATGQYLCFVPVDGFFEPEHIGKFSQPWFIYKKDRSLMFIEGLWGRNSFINAGTVTLTLTIFTTRQSPLIEAIHDRFPAIADLDEALDFINPENTDLDARQSRFRPYPPGSMSGHPVGKFVDYNNHGPECIEPVKGTDWGWLDGGWRPMNQETIEGILAEHKASEDRKKEAKKAEKKAAKGAPAIRVETGTDEQPQGSLFAE